jgi:hypothetical protein
MHLVDVDDLKSLKPRVSVIWSGSSTECRLEAPLFAMVSGTHAGEYCCVRVKNIELIKADFRILARSWSVPIDLLHIDGNHTYDDVRLDFSHWSAHMRGGRVTRLHDTPVIPAGCGTFFKRDYLAKIRIGACQRARCSVKSGPFRLMCADHPG